MVGARKQPVPITIVAGPRGAGKTTLVNRLLGERPFANAALILNDFGRVAPPGGLVEKAEDGLISLGSGCVCCAVRGALSDALENLIRDVDNGRVATIGRVVIEADAAADPSAILAAVERHPYLSLRFTADGIVAVLDAPTAAATLATRHETVRQVAMADIIVLARVASAAVRALLGQINPFAGLADAASVAASALIGHGPFDPATGDFERWLGVPGRVAPLAGEAARVRAFAVVREREVPFAALDRFIEYLATLQGPNLIRVRGAVATGENEAAVVDGLGGFFRPLLIVDRVPLPGTRFAVVARDLDRAKFETYLDAFLNEARVDAPDRQALTDNPLAIAGFSARSR